MSSPKIVFSRASCPAFTITTNGETGIRQIGRNFCSYVLSVRFLCSSFSYRSPKSTHLSEQTALRRCAVISCWGKGAVSIPIYVHANHSLSPLRSDLSPRPVRRRFCHEGNRQELPRYSRFQRFSLRQHVPSHFCGPKEHGDGDDSPWPAHRHQRRRAPDANAGAVGLGGNPQSSPCRQDE